VATADQSAMRASMAVVLAASLLCSGCLEVEQTVTLAANGSGRQVVRMALRESTLAALARASSAAEASANEVTKAVFDKDMVGRELTAAGLTLTTHRAERSGGRRTVEIEATFPTFAALQKSPLAGSRAEWVLAAGPREGTAKLTLYPQGQAAWTEARAKAEAMVGANDAVADAFFAKQREQLAGLDLIVRLQVPGDVLVWTKNMEKTGPREVVARVSAAQIQTPQDLVRRLAPRFEVIFDAAGCSLPLAGN
jgi:hypothetical protein